MKTLLLHAFMLFSGLIAAPFLLGVINRTKALFAGRKGAPLFQLYFDMAKLLRKGVTYSRTTTWIFRAAPVIGLSAVMTAMTLMPLARMSAPLSFPGDLVLFAYCLGLMRFVTVLAALDTGSSFEGMGASREVQFSALAEPVLIIAIAALVCAAGSPSLTAIFAAMTRATWQALGPALVLIVAALLVIFLVENARIPVDDPNTHLELTMIHEVMVLDYSGPDLAFILYAASLKLWVLGTLIVNIAISFLDLHGFFTPLAFTAGMLVLAVLVGIIESIMARLSLLKVPRLLMGALVLAVLAFAFIARFTS
ncbi:MAG: NADH-quinone oxidoreductase subunit H [Verrucomicrobia bacterium]|nr:NADH-quinone oxidoreductase subunit H [Verrucomicrobiota bacterium]